MVNVRALPSDVARLVLDYLYSEGLQETYDVFLQESPHLEEMRSFPGMGILPLGAKSLQVIVEEYYELMSQDSSKVKNANDALYKLWKRFDSLLVQIKHHYKGSGAITTLSNELASQSVRSRYSLNRLHHERMQLEREQVLRQVNSSALPQQQHHQQLQQQQQLLQNHQQAVHGQRQHRNSPFRRQPRQVTELDSRPPQMVSSPFPANQQSRERSCDARSSTPRSKSPMIQEVLSTSPSQSVTSTQSQFMTPTKSSQHDRQAGEEKVTGKSPKRKSAPPRRKPHSGVALERVMSSVPSTSAGVTPINEIQDLPSPWGSLCNNRELVEKLAENINRVLPAQELPAQEEPSDHQVSPNQAANLSAGTDESQQSGSNSNGQALDDLLNGMVSDSMMEEFVDMTSGDPTFNSLFALFNTDRDKFLSSERRKLQLSTSEVEEHLNSSRESEVGSSVEQNQMPPPSHPNQHPTYPSAVPSSSQGTTVTIINQGRHGDTQAMGSSTGHMSEVVGQNNISSTNRDRVFLIEEMEGLSSGGQDSFPNTVVRGSPVREDVACTTTELSGANSGKGSASISGVRPKDKSPGVIVGSYADVCPNTRVRVLSFVSDSSPAKKSLQDTSNETGAASTSQGTPPRRKGKEKGSHSPLMQRRNETTPSKRPVTRTPERMYSPEEKAVARLLTKLPATPTKENTVATTQPVIVDGKKVVIVKRARAGGPRQQTSTTGASGNHKDAMQIEQGAIPSVGHVNGVKLSDLPGHSRTELPPHGGKGEETVVLAKETKSNGSEGQIESREEDKDATKDVPHDKGKKPAKKGVKRERKDTDKVKGSKKTKRSKSKTNKDLGFPVNLDVDKFLSQINYTS